MLCGEKLGSGVSRDVFACKLRPELVVKVETDFDYRSFANVAEMRIWCDNRDHKAVADWLAPCEYLSPDGRILLQARVDVLQPPFKPGDKLPPDKIPAFLTDRKHSNFGWYQGRLVCCDYALTIATHSTRMTNAEYWS
jgi:hypothetical protein